MYGEKIRMIREMRGLSQENVATLLGIAQTTYSRIETNQTKLEAGMLTKVAEVLGVSPMDILSSQPAIINFQSNKGTQQSFGYVENVISGQKELYEKIIEGKDQEIARLNKIIEKLLSKKWTKKIPPKEVLILFNVHGWCTCTNEQGTDTARILFQEQSLLRICPARHIHTFYFWLA